VSCPSQKTRKSVGWGFVPDPTSGNNVLPDPVAGLKGRLTARSDWRGVRTRGAECRGEGEWIGKASWGL